MTEPRQRLLIFVVAYQAEATLADVLDRIPASLFTTYDSEVLVIDDSSHDRTFDIGLGYSQRHGQRITILYNRARLGYGGNQKLGCAYAVAKRFDLLVLLHADGHYAPEKIPELVDPIAAGEADAVLGSRFMRRTGWLRAGMRGYKVLGNRLLTWLQNRLLQVRLSEFHAGYRAFRVGVLQQIPFEYNTDEFHFDTELVIQLLIGRFRIREVAIPSYDGREIGLANGLRYAADVIRTTVKSRLQLVNVLYDRRFDLAGPGNHHYDLKLGYRSSHTLALDAVRPGSRVLDIGCGPGAFARQLASRGCRVTGMDRQPPADAAAFEAFSAWNPHVDRFDLDLSPFDSVLLLDIIEHLTDPEVFLDALRRSIAPDAKPPQFVITSGNVAFLVLRIQLLLGNFNYGKRGILDLTHTRLYTFATLQQLLEQCGFHVERTIGVPAPIPKVIGDTWLAHRLVELNQLLIALSRGIFSYQIFILARPLPTVAALLDQSAAAGKARAGRPE